LNYVVLLCIEFIILLIEEKVMSYVTVSEGHGYPLVVYICKLQYLVLVEILFKNCFDFFFVLKMFSLSFQKVPMMFL
jgi:hypothetical protein